MCGACITPQGKMGRITMTPGLRKRVREIPGAEGFWSDHAHESFEAAAGELKVAGWNEDRIVAFLTSLYQAAGSEYGG
jgi:hypothetical protein